MLSSHLLAVDKALNINLPLLLQSEEAVAEKPADAEEQQPAAEPAPAEEIPVESGDIPEATGEEEAAADE